MRLQTIHNSKIKNLHTIDKIVLFINLLFTATLLLSYLSPVTNPRNYSFIAILGFSYQVLLAANGVFLLYWTIRRRWYALLSLLVIMAGLPVLLATVGFRAPGLPPRERSTTSLRVMAFNVNKFEGKGIYEGEPSQHAILQLIQTMQPDIVSFEEYLDAKKDTGFFVHGVQQLLSSGNYYFVPFGTFREDSAGNAIFSKFPIINQGIIQSPAGLETKAIFADIRYQNKIFRYYSVHLAPVEMDAREKGRYLSGNVNLEKSSFITNKLAAAFFQRSYQVAAIKRNMDSCTYPYIVAGDFNDTPNSYAVNTLGEGTQNAFREKGSGFGVTYYSKFPKLQIDYILAKPPFTVLSYEAIDKEISDHKPVVSDLAFH